MLFDSGTPTWNTLKFQIISIREEALGGRVRMNSVSECVHVSSASLIFHFFMRREKIHTLQSFQNNNKYRKKMMYLSRKWLMVLDVH